MSLFAVRVSAGDRSRWVVFAHSFCISLEAEGLDPWQSMMRSVITGNVLLMTGVRIRRHLVILKLTFLVGHRFCCSVLFDWVALC